LSGNDWYGDASIMAGCHRFHFDVEDVELLEISRFNLNEEAGINLVGIDYENVSVTCEFSVSARFAVEFLFNSWLEDSEEYAEAGRARIEESSDFKVSVFLTTPIKHGDLVEAAACQLRSPFGRGIGQGERARRQPVPAKHCSEGLADRADLENRVFGDFLPAFLRCHTITEEVALAVDGYGNRHAGDFLLGHERAHRFIDNTAQVAIIRLARSQRAIIRDNSGSGEETDQKCRRFSHDR